MLEVVDRETNEARHDSGVLERDRSAYQARLTAAGIDVTLLLPDERGTLGLDRATPAGPSVEDLPPLVGTSPVLALGARLAEGGMGIIREAVQIALDRPVAVKHLRADRDGPEARMHLLREARATGAVEHPNVVPVLALGRGAGGEPLLVMKRIEGVPWGRLLGDPEAHRRYPTAATTALEFHLSVLVQISNAVHYAHSRGIVHRDLKPENVMIGAFGEVYVLDWGLAVAIRPDAERWAPPAREIRQVAGTPASMAPEMAAADAALIGERTDVYLLGAMLHEVLTGRSRHEGATLLDTLTRAFVSAPVAYGPAVPRELGAIANKATSFDPLVRHESAAAFREEITDFLRHAGSRRLTEEAAERARTVGELMDREAAGHAIDTAELRRAGIEAWFGFQQALKAWPDNAQARGELTLLRRRLCAYEIDNGNRDAAAAVLAEMDPPEPDLAERLVDLDRRLLRREREIASLERLRHDTELGVHAEHQRRSALLIGAGLLAMVGTMVAIRILTGHRAGYAEAVGVMLYAFVVLTAVTIRQLSRENLAQRHLRRTLQALWLGLACLFGICALLELELTVAIALALFVAGFSIVSTGILVAPLAALAGVPLGLAALLVPIFPEQRGIVVSAGVILAVAVFARTRVVDRAPVPPRGSSSPPQG
jgi:serine/threonine-protein kinase